MSAFKLSVRSVIDEVFSCSLAAAGKFGQRSRRVCTSTWSCNGLPNDASCVDVLGLRSRLVGSEQRVFTWTCDDSANNICCADEFPGETSACDRRLDSAAL